MDKKGVMILVGGLIAAGLGYFFFVRPAYGKKVQQEAIQPSQPTLPTTSPLDEKTAAIMAKYQQSVKDLYDSKVSKVI